jgi:guanine deaminase
VTRPSLVVTGSIFQTPEPDRLDCRESVSVVVDPDGLIEDVHLPGPVAERAKASAERSVELDDHTVLIPGMVDLHIHAPQWPQLGTGLDLPLEEWLVEHTFPLEERYADLSFARRVWADLVPALLSRGTTTAVYYATVHGPATLALAEACIEHGQRAFVGRVAMDHPQGTPESYRDASATDGIAASRESIELIRALGSDLVHPIITPRFIPACTDDLLGGLGRLAAETGALVQTHCSESDWEHNHVLDRHGVSDASALDRFGLIRPGSVLAHADHVSAEDLDLIASRRAGIAHCPLSNIYFGNAVFPARRALAAGVNVGLGTDIAGGAEPALLSQVAAAVNVSRLLEDGVDSGVAAADRGVADSRIDVVKAFWMATLGGANVLNAPIGLLAPGRQFDAVAVSTSGLGIWPEIDDSVRIFEKLTRLAGRSDIERVWVAGHERHLRRTA